MAKVDKKKAKRRPLASANHENTAVPKISPTHPSVNKSVARVCSSQTQSLSVTAVSTNSLEKNQSVRFYIVLAQPREYLWS